MNATANQSHQDAVGTGVIETSDGPNVTIKYYVADRPSHTGRLAAEVAVDISITIPRPVREVWPKFKEFNSWMNRFGYVWDGVPGNNQDRFVYLRNTAGANNLNYGLDGSRTKYIVRKVIPERLIYFDSQPLPLVDKDGVWTGHNVMSLHEEGGQTKISIFMEHTWYSQTMNIEELRAEAKGLLDSGLAFWRDYFVPDLLELIETKTSSLA